MELDPLLLLLLLSDLKTKWPPDLKALTEFSDNAEPVEFTDSSVANMASRLNFLSKRLQVNFFYTRIS